MIIRSRLAFEAALKRQDVTVLQSRVKFADWIEEYRKLPGKHKE